MTDKALGSSGAPDTIACWCKCPKKVCGLYFQASSPRGPCCQVSSLLRPSKLASRSGLCSEELAWKVLCDSTVTLLISPSSAPLEPAMMQTASSHGQSKTFACDVQERLSTMLGSFVDSKHQQEFEDILACHVVPRLRLCDAQAFSWACSSLHRVVQTSLPAATWAILASCNFLPGHPIPAADSWHMQTEMAQLVQFHASVCSGKCVCTAKACHFQGYADRDETDSLAYLSHSGELSVCLRTGRRSACTACHWQ